MSFLEDPDIKKTYDKCKYIVKIWEHKFIKKYKRIPSKLDIREAPTNVRHAYRKYFRLKTAALEESFMDVELGLEEDEEGSTNGNNTNSQAESFIEPDSLSQLQLSNDNFTEDVLEEPLTQDVSEEHLNSETACPVLKENISDNQASEDVWGSHLNRNMPKEKEDECKDKALSEPVQSITKKLFCGSKINKLKRNPRKTMSFSQKKNTETSFESPSFLSQPERAFSSFKSEDAIEILESEMQNTLFNRELDCPETVKQIFSQPVNMNIVNSMFDKDQQNLRKVDTGWLKRVTQTTGISLKNPELSHFESNQNAQTEAQNVQAVGTKIDYDQDYDSDEIVGDSDEEQNVSINISMFHIAKKSRLTFDPKCNQEFNSFNSPNATQANSNSNPLTKNITNTVPVHKPIEVKDCNASQISKDITTELKTVDVITPINTISKIQEQLEKKPKRNVNKKPAQKTPRSKKKVNQSHPSEPTLIDGSKSLRRSSRKNIVKASFEELSSGEEDPFASEHDEGDPEFTLESEKPSNKYGSLLDLHSDLQESEDQFDESIEKEMVKKKVGKKVQKRVSKGQNSLTKEKNPRQSKSKKTASSASQEVENLQESHKYELEYNVKPRIVTSRFGNLKSVIKQKLLENSKESKDQSEEQSEIPSKSEKDKSGFRDKRQQAKEKLEQKIASGGLNDNFVTINIKKKVFARGKKTQNFSKYKKAMWKSKKKALYGPDMDMGGCDGGKLVCFNCGQEGHFAQRCKVVAGDGLLPLDAAQQEEECPYPTLKEATEMAAESILSIRKPKLNVENNDNKPLQLSGNVVTTEAESNNEESKNTASTDEEWMEDDIENEMLLAEIDKLEDHVKKLDVKEYMDNVKVVKPYYDQTENESLIDTPKEVYEALEKFGHTSFRSGQEKAVMRILSGKSTLVTLSTGSGKSLCYQLPAYLYSQREPCISLIISPLVSLMEDQVVGIPKFLKAACLHTNQTETQRQKIMDAISTGDLHVLLISPEAVVAGEKRTGFGSLFRKLPPIAFACIDEAHCVSQWSHNFRPSYLMVCRVLKESLGVRTILGLTATATRSTCESIIKSLDIPDGFEGIISDIPLPENLHLTVSKDASRDRALVNLLLSERFKDCRSIIVYCTRREECERIAAFLRTSLKSEVPVESGNKKRKRLNLQAEPYHAGLSASRRRTVQNSFMSGQLRIVVATVAFGMGINKSDIRSVIHFNMPNSFESYVQEVGRAGRDGLPAHCHLFLDSQGRDENELRRHIHANSLDRHVIRKLLQKIFVPCGCKGLCPKHEVAFSIEETVRELDIPEENISTLLCYLELHANKYIELLNPGYTNCKIISYGGPLQIRKAAKECPPLAMALALYSNKNSEDNVLEFPVIDVASAMGWESGICKHKLKNLEWVTVNNAPKRSSLSIQYSNLGFRLLAPGNLVDDQLDEALDNLFDRVQSQETKALKQLHAVHKTMLGVAEKSYLSCIDVKNKDERGDLGLKHRIREYFNSVDPLADLDSGSSKIISEEQLISDIRAMICMYRDNQFTGRALARIFHGIQSPNYPAVIWGRGKFWRSHINEDFHDICRIATREIIKMR